MNLNYKNTAYDEGYLESVMKVHGCLFSKLSEIEEYDVFSMIDAYMQHSGIRRKMDEGNWSALNKGYKQLLNSIDFTLCKPRKNTMLFDDILLGWIADIYVLLQWRYNIQSAKISQKLSAEELCRAYNPLHETSYENACEKLHRKYLV